MNTTRATADLARFQRDCAARYAEARYLAALGSDGTGVYVKACYTGDEAGPSFYLSGAELAAVVARHQNSAALFAAIARDDYAEADHPNT